jgi:hypothetical protein
MDIIEQEWKDWLIIYALIFHLYWDVKTAGKGLVNLGLCSVLRTFEQGGIFIVTGGLCFSGLIQKTAPFSRLL